MRKVLFVCLLPATIQLKAQDSTVSRSFSAYAEIYYQYDFNKPADNNRPFFIYSHNRHNEFNLNLGFLKAAYTASWVRANLAVGTGTYMNANYADEPGVLKNIVEADAGIRLCRSNLWLDVGIMPSHIGFESAASKDCWNLTRSMSADNSPYFEAGAKLTYTSGNGKWLLGGMILNGWQHITRLPGKSRTNWGTQIQFRPTDKIMLNYSTFIGTDKPDSAGLNRFFHDFYSIFNVSDRFGIIAGFDIGTEKKNTDSPGGNTWYAPVLILKYAFNDKWSIAGRGEYYNDPNGVIITTGIPGGFKTAGFSLNVDHSPAKNVLARIEIRNFSSKQAIFNKGAAPVKSNIFITSSIAVSF